MEQVGIHQIDTFVILPREHGIEAVDLGETAPAPCSAPRDREGAGLEPQEVIRPEYLGQDYLAVKGRVGGVVADRAVVFVELDETGVLDAVGFGWRRGER